MFGNHPSMLFELSAIYRAERIEQAHLNRLIAEARRGQEPHAGIVRSLRRSFGAAMIASGHWIHGERPAAIESTQVPSAGTLRMAR